MRNTQATPFRRVWLGLYRISGKIWSELFNKGIPYFIGIEHVHVFTATREKEGTMIRIIIDGYNLLFRMGSYGGGSLEDNRDGLMDMLSEYAVAKKKSLIVVFDGQKVARERIAGRKGVRAFFTDPPESADDRIVKLARSLREKALVVTSDSGIVSRIAPLNCGTATVEEFLPKIEEAFAYSLKGEIADDERSEKREKKGPSRRSSKKARKKKRYLDKL